MANAISMVGLTKHYTIESGGALLDEIQSFADRGIAKIDSGNHDLVELSIDQRGAPRVDLRLLDDRGCAHFETTNGQFPTFVHLTQHIAASLVVGGSGIFIAGAIDALHTASRGDIVFVNIENLLVALEGQIKASGGVEAVGLEQQLFYFLDICDESRSERPVEPRGILELAFQRERRPIIGRVTILEHDFHRRRGVLVATLGDALHWLLRSLEVDRPVVVGHRLLPANLALGGPLNSGWLRESHNGVEGQPSGRDCGEDLRLHCSGGSGSEAVWIERLVRDEGVLPICLGRRSAKARIVRR